MRSVHFASLADCPACRVQGAVVETWDAKLPGVAVSSRCRMCSRELDMGQESKPATALSRLSDVERALTRWAHEEGHDDVADFVASAFVLASLPAVHAALILGDPVETSFDVMGFLFSHMGGGSPGVDAGAVDAPASDPALSSRAVLRAPPAPILAAVGARAFHERNELLALAATAAADGAVVDVERAFLDAFARNRGLAVLGDHELRVFRPDEIGPVGSLLDRERVLEKMVELAFIDAHAAGDELDESEVRVIRGFARSWGVDPARIDAWLRAWADEGATLFAKLLKRAARHLFPEA